MKKTPMEIYSEAYCAAYEAKSSAIVADGVNAVAAHARRDALEDAMTACLAEHLSNPQSEEDAVYDQAVADCVCAIKGLASKYAAPQVGVSGQPQTSAKTSGCSPAAAAPSGPSEGEVRIAMLIYEGSRNETILTLARAVLRWNEQTKGATVDELSDLEITRLCAEAIKLCTIPSPKGYENLIIEAGTSMPYRPLHDRAQWAELVERFRLIVGPVGDSSWSVVAQWSNKENSYCYVHADLAHAVCLCVAKTQLAKVGK